MLVRKIAADSIEESVLEEASAALLRGELVVFPTETVYGLGAIATDENAVAKIFATKGRPSTHALICHVADFAVAERYIVDPPKEAFELAKRFWPGPLTLIFRKHPSIPAITTGGGETVAIRVPSHPVALALLRKVGAPVAAPSANPYQSISPTCADHVVRAFEGRAHDIVLLLDGGPSHVGVESTVVDLSVDPPMLLRPGALSFSELRGVLPNLRNATTSLPGAPDHRAPGQDAKHYAPKARVRLCSPSELASHKESRDPNSWVGYIRFGRSKKEEAEEIVERTSTHDLSADPTVAMASLFSSLHAFDAWGAEEIVIEVPPQGEAWDAVRDRVQRAAGLKIL